VGIEGVQPADHEGKSEETHDPQPPPSLPTAGFLDQCLRIRLSFDVHIYKLICHGGATVPGTMVTVKVDRDDPLPLHDQVAAEIRRAIANGEAQPGERLPPARDLAAILKVNSNTVFRALRVLRDEGLLEFRRGRGITVTGAAPKKSPVIAMARELLRVARRHGVRREELIQIIEGLSS